MSLLVKTKSVALRVRDNDAIISERIGELHKGAPLLEWGSISKTLTAGVAEQLHRSGELDLGTPVVALLPETQLPEAVDLRSLAEHTSGLPRLPADMKYESLADVRDPYAKFTAENFDSDVLPTLGALPLTTAGEMAYSNLGYAVLTRALERARGEAWLTLVTRHICEPLGVTGVQDQADPHRSPLLRTWSGAERTQWTMGGPFVGAGGAHSTFDALEAYAIGTVRAARGMKPLGWMLGGSLWWHNGHTRDHGAFVGVSPDGSRVITGHSLGYGVRHLDRLVKREHARHPLQP